MASEVISRWRRAVSRSRRLASAFDRGVDVDLTRTAAIVSLGCSLIVQ
jgi:hypothetical protein